MKPPFEGSKSGARAIVLVITLALVVLITFVVVAFFSRTITNRRIESAASGGVRADILARAACQFVLADFRSEIAAGSQVVTQQGRPIYMPSDPQKVVPCRTLSSGLAADPSFNSLVKQSVDAFFPNGSYTGTPLIAASSGITTDIPSVNKKVVGAARWNGILLNTGSGFSASNQLPHWILVDRLGIAPSQTWNNAFRDYTPGNDSAVIGRFAFNIYDVGGLLDANVAGYPIFSTALTAGQLQSLKSTETGAHLYDSSSGVGIIPDFSSAMQTNFVNTWRFGSTATSSANFLLDFMTRTVPASPTISPTFADSGFMRPTVRSPGSISSDTNTFAFSRQDLLRLPNASTAYITTNGLRYFSHFTRELNAPSWRPQTPAGSTVDYAGQAELPTATNRNIPNFRVKQSFLRTDGTAAVAGEPLMKNRFPLRRLDAIGSTGINASAFPVMVGGILQAPTAATVQRDFGLVWNSANSRWNYVGATGSTVQSAIATLEQVATANREPNFFEILKAFILSGSVGLGSDNSGVGRTFVDAEARYYQQSLRVDSQIIQIGANLIDQWDADKNPTFIFFGTNEFAGVENLPFLQKLGFQPRWTSAIAFSAWLVPSFWTPGQNGTAVGTQSTTIPIVRFVMTAGHATGVVESSTATASSNTVNGSPTQPLANLTTSFNFNLPDGASSATTIKVGMTGTPDGRLGIPLTFTLPAPVTKANTTRAYPRIDNATFEMQAQVGGSIGPWKTYQRWSGCTVNVVGVTAACDTSPTLDWGTTTLFDPEFVLLDPRTMRFGVWETHASGTGDPSDYARGLKETLDSGGTSGFQKVTSMGPQGSSFSGVGAEMANNAMSSPGYIDLDGIRRQGDILSSGTTSAMLATNSVDRSPILSRQIRSVAELGTISRDQPWKTLNFTTVDSADAGLLDAFTIFEPNSVFRSDIVAGKLSLNTRQPIVLQAALAGIATNTNNSTPLISSSQRLAIANALVAMTSSQPMLNKSELVTRFAADPSVAALGNKEAREAVIRALSDVGQTRTWNLTIDVIAQSGKFSANAAAADEFIVTGEKRYWLHVAIDRFTSEVIDQQLETVYE